MTTLYTIGYQSATMADFLEALTEAGVTLLVDVRRVASSRRPGFAKSALAANLAGAGIEYRHIRAVGTPADGRAAAKAGDHATMRRIFLEHLATDEAQGGLSELETLLRGDQVVCIMCFEDDPAHCHRTMVADALRKRLAIAVTDLRPAIEG